MIRDRVRDGQDFATLYSELYLFYGLQMPHDTAKLSALACWRAEAPVAPTLVGHSFGVSWTPPVKHALHSALFRSSATRDCISLAALRQTAYWASSDRQTMYDPVWPSALFPRICLEDPGERRPIAHAIAHAITGDNAPFSLPFAFFPCS